MHSEQRLINNEVTFNNNYLPLLLWGGQSCFLRVVEGNWLQKLVSLLPILNVSCFLKPENAQKFVHFRRASLPFRLLTNQMKIQCNWLQSSLLKLPCACPVGFLVYFLMYYSFICDLKNLTSQSERSLLSSDSDVDPAGWISIGISSLLTCNTFRWCRKRNINAYRPSKAFCVVGCDFLQFCGNCFIDWAVNSGSTKKSNFKKNKLPRSRLAVVFNYHLCFLYKQPTNNLTSARDKTHLGYIPPEN